MQCVILNVKNPLNYDVVFVSGDIRDYGIDAKSGEEAILCRVNPLTFATENEQKYPTYKLRIHGVKATKNSHLGEVQYAIVRWNNSNGGVFTCYPLFGDKYGRIICDIRDSVTDLSVTTWLLTSYPDIFSKF